MAVNWTDGFGKKQAKTRPTDVYEIVAPLVDAAPLFEGQVLEASIKRDTRNGRLLLSLAKKVQRGDSWSYSGGILLGTVPAAIRALTEVAQAGAAMITQAEAASKAKVPAMNSRQGIRTTHAAE